ncbi:rhodanese-like domain-containing protein [Tahibacter soli]|uniref:Rhodanese-like domain-containing protein n=1 Tax=Tahibacter soli TaxID=2983605 RepID=A0A9X3YNR7_9GAMM|nr:rhodanese-like domain-containing protein [Tahibacter soli]MDC8015682.1 rhodanese-like domain-containing protein [Tahibacter soli]
MIYALLMGVPNVAPRALHAMLQNPDVHVFDVNAPQHFRAAHVPRASNLDPLAFTADDLPAAKDATLVFYCSSTLCRKGPQAAQRAKRFGYANASVMSAGIAGWLAAGLPTEGA